MVYLSKNMRKRISYKQKPDNIFEIPNTNGLYFCSKEGKAFSAPKLGNGFKWVELREGNVNGYYNVKIKINGKPKSCILHRLIATTFIPNPLKKSTVNHINGIKTDNKVGNLEWATRKENSQHAYDTKLHIAMVGESNPLSKVTNKDAIYIAKSNLKISELSELYGINKSSISAIRTGRLWSEITGIKYSSKILSENIVLEIYNSDLSGRKLSKKYSVSENTVSAIKTGRNWSSITNHKYPYGKCL